MCWRWCIFIFGDIYICVRMHVCRLCAGAYIVVCTQCLHVYIYICLNKNTDRYICIYAYTYIPIYIYTHMKTRTGEGARPLVEAVLVVEAPHRHAGQVVPWWWVRRWAMGWRVVVYIFIYDTQIYPHTCIQTHELKLFSYRRRCWGPSRRTWPGRRGSSGSGASRRGR